MWDKPLNIIKWFFQPLLGKNINQWKVVVISFCVATTFWLLNQLNKDYTHTFEYPLEFNYNEGKLIPIESLPEEIKVSVSGKGWDLWRESRNFGEKPIIIQVDSFPNTKLLTKNQLLELFETRKNAVNIEEILTDSVAYGFDYKINTFIALEINSDSIFASEGYAIIPPFKVIPDTIYVEGAAKELKKIGKSFKINLVMDDLDDDVEQDIELADYIDNITLNREEVEVIFRVSPLVTKTLELPYSVINSRIDTSLLMLEPKIARIEIKYPKALESELYDSLFTLELNLHKKKFAADTSMPLELITKPSFVTETNIITSRIGLVGKE